MRTAVVMPARNEQAAIGDFLVALEGALRDWRPVFVVVDDHSLDETTGVVADLVAQGMEVVLVSNEENLGHGPSTLRALRHGLETGADYVISIDGDGQFLAHDVENLLIALHCTDAPMAEGVRVRRTDPSYRVAVSVATQFLVWTRCGRWPTDANTPLRAYRRSTLVDLLPLVPEGSVIPNLHLSVYSRRRLPILEVPVRSVPRHSIQEAGGSWGNGRAWVPSRRFVRFCVSAVSDWYRPRRGISATPPR